MPFAADGSSSTGNQSPASSCTAITVLSGRGFRSNPEPLCQPMDVADSGNSSRAVAWFQIAEKVPNGIRTQ